MSQICHQAYNSYPINVCWWTQDIGPNLRSFACSLRLGSPHHASNTKQIISDYLLLLLSEIFGGIIKKGNIVWFRPIYSRNCEVLVNFRFFKNDVASIPCLDIKNPKREKILLKFDGSTDGICISRFHRSSYDISTC